MIGAPFYLMTYVEGWVLTAELPPALDTLEAPARIAEELVDHLVELHKLESRATRAWRRLGRPGRLSGPAAQAIRRPPGE